MKKTNIGFSMVELIIVIAIMAILAGALAPALIKYINKSRISADISTGNTIAGAIQTALSDEKAYDSANDSALTDFVTYYGNQGTDMQNALKGILGTDVCTTAAIAKSTKDVKKGSLDKTFYVVVDTSTSQKIEVYLGDKTGAAGHMVYPTVGTDLQY